MFQLRDTFPEAFVFIGQRFGFDSILIGRPRQFLVGVFVAGLVLPIEIVSCFGLYATRNQHAESNNPYQTTGGNE